MNLNGGNVQKVPNTLGAGPPRWSRKDEPFLIFSFENAHLVEVIQVARLEHLLP